MMTVWGALLRLALKLGPGVRGLHIQPSPFRPLSDGWRTASASPSAM